MELVLGRGTLVSTVQGHIPDLGEPEALLIIGLHGMLYLYYEYFVVSVAKALSRRP